MSVNPHATAEAVDWQDRVNRIGRPLGRLVGVSVVLLWGLALVAAAWISAITGRPMPDMTGGIAPLIIGLAPFALDLLTRHRERMAGHA